MEFQVTDYKRCSVVKATGRIDSSTAPQLADILDQLLQKGQYKIVLDMDGVEFISSSGLRVLINTLKTCRRHKGDFILTCVPERVHSALDLAGFIPFLKIYKDVTSAVAQF